MGNRKQQDFTERVDSLKLELGDEVLFQPAAGNPRKGKVLKSSKLEGTMLVFLDGDPFATALKIKQLQKIKDPVTYNQQTKNSVPEGETMATSFKELRKEAKQQGIEGFEEMDKDELKAALSALVEEEEQEVPVATAKKGKKKSKKVVAEVATTKVKKSKKAASSNGSKPKAEATAKMRAAAPTKNNPFRQGSNSYLIVERLKKGGSREAMINDIMPQLALRPTKNVSNSDTDTITVRGRIMKALTVLEKEYNWKVRKDGRGDDAFLKATPPKS